MASKWVLTQIYPTFKVGCNPFTNHSLPSGKKNSSRAPPSMVDHWRTHRGKKQHRRTFRLDDHLMSENLIGRLGERHGSTMPLWSLCMVFFVHVMNVVQNLFQPTCHSPNKCQESRVKKSNEVLWISKQKKLGYTLNRFFFFLVNQSCQDGAAFEHHRKQIFGRFAGGFPCRWLNRIFGRLEGVFRNQNFHGPPFASQNPSRGSMVTG